MYRAKYQNWNVPYIPFECYHHHHHHHHFFFFFFLRHYNFREVLAFSTNVFHLVWFLMQSFQFVIFILVILLFTSSSHLFLGLPSDLVSVGDHSYTFFLLCCHSYITNAILSAQLTTPLDCQWTSKWQMFQGIIVPSSLGSSSLQWESFPFFLILKVRALQSFKILGVTHCTRQCHLNLKQHHCQNLT